MPMVNASAYTQARRRNLSHSKINSGDGLADVIENAIVSNQKAAKLARLCVRAVQHVCQIKLRARVANVEMADEFLGHLPSYVCSAQLARAHVCLIADLREVPLFIIRSGDYDDIAAGSLCQ